MPAVQQRFKTHAAPWAGSPVLLPALSLAALAPAAAWAAYTLLELRLAPGADPGWMPGATGGLVAWVWVLALAPMVEEAVMRPLFQTGLRQQLGRIQRQGWGTSNDWRGYAANAGTALVFAMLHVPANGVAALWWLLPAVAIGEVWRRSASWPLCVLLHAWFNANLAAVTVLNR